MSSAPAPRRLARGHIEQRRDASWCLRISNTVDGCRHQPRIDLGNFSCKRDAREAADRWLARDMGVMSTGPTITGAQIFERFMRVDAMNVRPSSRRRYDRLMRRLVIPQLGARAVNQIGTAAVREHLAELAAAGVSQSTLRGVRQIILQALRSAEADGVAVIGVLDTRRIRIPGSAKPPRRIIPVEQHELERILAASEFPWRALWALLFYAGLRIAEGLALTWSDIDFPARRITIARQAIAGELVLPKTMASIAERPLLPELERILIEYRSSWRHNAQQLLFATARGTPYLADNVLRRRWYPLLDSLALPRRGLHCLRHGLSRHLLDLGVSIDVVQKMLRHSSLSITQRYTHGSSDVLRSAIDAAIARNAASQEASRVPERATDSALAAQTVSHSS